MGLRQGAQPGLDSSPGGQVLREGKGQARQALCLESPHLLRDMRGNQGGSSDGAGLATAGMPDPLPGSLSCAAVGWKGRGWRGAGASLQTLPCPGRPLVAPSPVVTASAPVS